MYGNEGSSCGELGKVSSKFTKSESMELEAGRENGKAELAWETSARGSTE